MGIGLTIGSVADWIAALATLGGVIFAVIGFSKYREQINYEQNRELSVRIASSVFRLRAAMREYRRLQIPEYEIAEARRRYAAKVGVDQDSVTRKTASDAVFDLRWERVALAARDFETAAAEAEWIWSAEWTEALRETVFNPVRELSSATMQFVNFDQWSDGRDKDELSKLRRIIFDSGSPDEPDPFERSLRAMSATVVRMLDERHTGAPVRLVVIPLAAGYRVALERPSPPIPRP